MQWLVGKRYQVLGFQKNIDSQYRCKLLAMGFVPNQIFEVIREAPLRDPIEIRLKHARLSLRKREAEGLIVQEVP